MARERGPRGKLCRRLGIPLSRISAKDPDKDPVLRRPYPPGQHGATARVSVSDFAQRLREKQKLKLYYGLLEKQCRGAFLEARRSPGNTGKVLMQLLERRLDALVLRAGLATSIRQARQFVRHGYFQLDGRRVDIPSLRLTPGNEVRFQASHLKLAAVQEALGRMKARQVPAYVQVLGEGEGMRLVRLPEREEIPVDVNEPFIVEYYAQRS
ncbi:30S ribosomal protein S4 [Corallococcus llansteffanensis]|uniref:Small ribosomal subunit protein uS4 n=1 Tax=Corallococcus llansteffanensis TaxID=2316731 RepID=A0A3A8PWZ8_9BACT|nr:30S ribosomal protein S4 [Corallococcus llansteffanensis]RKH60508.1 30S ribosomal protein S4 [Corallococcus llansteffanensis]